MKKRATIYLLAGHNTLQSGAVGVAAAGEPPFVESEQAILLRNAIVKYLPKSANVVVDDDAERLPALLERLAEGMMPDDVCVEIHFNAFYSPEVSGTEVYVKDDANADLRRFAAGIAQRTSDALSTPNRGVKAQRYSQHRSLVLLGLPCRTVLWEVCFCTSPNDVCRYYRERDVLAREIAGVLLKGC